MLAPNAADEAFADIMCSGQDNPEEMYLAIVGGMAAAEAVLGYGSEAGLTEAFIAAGMAGAAERAFACWWLAGEYAEGRVQFPEAA